MDALLILLLFSWPLLGLLIGLTAADKNRNGWLWGIMGGGVFFLPAALVLSFLPYLCPKCKHGLTNKEWKNWSCPKCSGQDHPGLTESKIEKEADRDVRDEQIQEYQKYYY